MHASRLGLPLVLLALSCVGDPEGATIGKRESAIGVPDNGFPGWEERVLLVLTNRARVDPTTECAGTCTAYPASLPLAYDANAGRAGRFQSTSLIKAKAGLMHESVCTLVANLGAIYPASCDGDPSCACVGGAATCTCANPSPYCTAVGGLTPWNTRVGRFGVGAAGENLAAGSADPLSAFNQWVHSSGHWSNINNAQHAKLGTGFFAAAGGCWSALSAQVFLGGARPADVLFGGAHHPKSGSTTTSFKFWANYLHAAAPQLATVNIDGTCYPMTVERGSAANGTYLVQQTIPTAGCHRYYLYFRDGAGGIVSYPSVGSLGVGVGGAVCADFVADQRPAPQAGCGGCSTSADCDDKNPCTTDSCVAGQCQSAPLAGCCASAAQCDDKNPCTADSCVANKCQNAPLAACCASAADCDDKNPCTTDSCVASKCQSTPLAGCCASAADCDDKNPCTTDACVGNTCQSAPLGGCCTSAAQCDDQSACTTDGCVGNKCVFTPVTACCAKDADCGTGDACTKRVCQAGTCQLNTTPGCCTVDAECVDADACTRDTCNTTSHACEHPPISGCNAPKSDGGGAKGDGGSPKGDGGGVKGDGGRAKGDGGSPDGIPIGFPRPDPERGPRLAGGCAIAATAGASGSATPLLLLALVGLARGRRRRRSPSPQVARPARRE